MTLNTAPTALPQPFGRDFPADPHAMYARLREQGSVHRVALPDGSPVWLVTREADVRQGLVDPRLSVNKRHSGTGFKGFALPPALDANLLNIDADDHLRLRRLVSQGFTPRHVESLRGSVQTAVDARVDRLVERMESEGRADVVEEFARPLPLTVIGELLAVPEAERGKFSGWVAGMLSPASREELTSAIGAIHGFLLDLVAERRAHPGDDMLSDLIAARDDEDRLTENELVSLAFLLLMAGSENVQHLLGNGLLTLLTHPRELAALRARPDLLPQAVEELLRHSHPNHTAIRRFPTEPVEIGGVRIPAGDTVLFSLAAAHRDPARYPAPDRFDLDRADKAHLSLGHGLHYCLGAPLARMQVTLALGTLLRRLPSLRLACPVEKVPWTTTFRFHAVRELPVAVSPG
ncbi:cytochrome P450 [Streptomyces sp. NBC_00047]|uniref:cytochrome P450 family protein n=1 Tax=Streptomyces sp. NBC_00047 TaxID=2975627 RepID=UPI00224EE7EE|nr:cytochrome P450 [Streptomyces sp. NBC_00047]MCX5609325.1 cytochrome P450 [Streptomyces sp. NBC_00047]